MTTLTYPEPDLDEPAAVLAPAGGRSRAARLLRGREEDPAWVRPTLAALLVGTAFLYLWGLGASGWANSFYSAAVQAGTKSWKAFFFGSSDAANAITVDKSPAFLWPMVISARIFGVNSWSILVPQALEGVAAVALLYATVRRWFTPAAALLAGAVLALTPVAALMFRFNNPDALLVLLLTAAAYATVRAIESGRMRWIVLVGAFVGFAFLAKMLQALLVVPGFGLAYLIAAPVAFRRRVAHLLAAGVALVVSAGWWVAAVELWPASSRPYIGGSQNNSVLNLIFGYNGFGRLTGSESGSVGGGGGQAGRWGPTGWTRLFNAQFGGQIAWLLPAALVLLAAGLVLTWRRTRTDRTRAAFVLWGGWLLVTGAAISLGQGIIHPYYTVALAPAIGALVGIGAATLWARRDHVAARGVLAAALGATAVCSYFLLRRTPNWNPSLRGLVLVGGIALAGVLFAWRRMAAGARVAIALAAIAVALAGPAAYALETASSAHTGAIPSAGPAVAGGFGLPGGFGGPGGAAGRAGGPPKGFAPPNGGGAFPGVPGGGFPGGPGATGGAPGGTIGTAPGGTGGAGGLLAGSTPTKALTTALEHDAHRYTWIAATVGANEASGYQLATGDPVMAIGGFNGTDPSPTLARFQQYVRAGKIHYFIAGGRGGFAGRPGGAFGATSSTSSAITSWVEANFTATTIGGVTVYDLTSPTHGSST